MPWHLPRTMHHHDSNIAIPNGTDRAHFGIKLAKMLHARNLFNC